MSDIRITPDTLDAAASNLDSLHSELESLKAIPTADRDSVGGASVFAALERYSDVWRFGVSEIEGSVTELAVGLRQASKTYRHGEATITASFAGTGGGTGSKTGGGTRTGTGRGHGGSGGSAGGTGEKQVTATVDRITDPRIAQNSNLKAFIVAMAVTTGLNPLVIAAWTLQEGGSSYGGQYNYLNIGNTDSEAYGVNDGVWTNPAEAGKYSGLWLEGKYSLPGFGYASPGVQSIERSAGESGPDQVSAIQHSGWASSGEPILGELYDELARQAG